MMSVVYRLIKSKISNQVGKYAWIDQFNQS